MIKKNDKTPKDGEENTTPTGNDANGGGGNNGNGGNGGDNNSNPPPKGLKKVFKQTPRWFLVIAIISISANLLIVGAVGGKIAFFAFDDDHVSAFGFISNARKGYRFYKKLPDHKREHLKDYMKGFRGFARSKESELRQYTIELKQVISKEHLSEADLKAVSRKFYMTGNDFFENFEKNTISFILSLSYDERIEFAEMINFRRPKAFKYHGRGHKFRSDHDDDWD